MAKGYEVFVDDKGGEEIVLPNGQRLSVGVYEAVVGGDELEKLAALEKIVFGGGAFGEYAICSARAERGNCGLVLSHDSLIDEKVLPDCPACGSYMEEVFPTELHIRYLKWIFNHGVKSVLLFNEFDEIVGFSLMFVARLEDCLNNINYRKGYDENQVHDAVQRCLGPFSFDQEFVCANRVGFSPAYQGFGLLPFILRKNAAQFSDAENKPAIGDTMIHPSGKLFALVVAAGYNPLTCPDGNLMIDEHGGVLLAISRFGDFIENLELGPDNFLNQCGERLLSARLLQTSICDRYPGPGERKYSHSPILRSLADNSDVQVFEANDFNDKVICEFANLFREVFANAFGQYVFYPSRGVPIPIEEFFGGGYIEVDALDALNLSDESLIVDGESPVFWHHPQFTLQVMCAKLSMEGKLSALFNDGRMVGFAFGYQAPLIKVWNDLEEWFNPQLYSGTTTILQKRDLHLVLPIIENCLQSAGLPSLISIDSDVFIFNAIALVPAFRSRGNLKRMLRKFFLNFDDEYDDKLVFLETKFQSKAYEIFLRAGAYMIDGVLNTGILNEGDVVMMVGKFRSFRLSFCFNEL